MVEQLGGRLLKVVDDGHHGRVVSNRELGGH